MSYFIIRHSKHYLYMIQYQIRNLKIATVKLSRGLKTMELIKNEDHVQYNCMYFCV